MGFIGDIELKKYITNYYKNLFDQPDETNITMVESQRDDIPRGSGVENELLTAIFIEAEIKQEVFQMDHNKAPRPYGFPAKFYQVF